MAVSSFRRAKFVGAAGACSLVGLLWPAIALGADEVVLELGRHEQILVLLGIVATAYLLSYLLLRWLAGRFGFVTAAPYVVLGAVVAASADGVGQVVLESMEPLLALAVGVAGLVAGLGVNLKSLRDEEGTTVKLALTVVAATVAMVVVIPWVALNRWGPALSEGMSWAPVVLMLGAVALVADGRPVAALARYLRLELEAVEQAQRLARLSTLMGLLLFGILFVVANPGPGIHDSSLDDLLWLAAHLGVGVVLGFVGGTLMQARPADDRMLTILLGLVVTASGLAYVTTLSIVFVNFVVGLVLINVSSESLRLKKILDDAHGPAYILLLFFAGTLWTVEIPAWGYLGILAFVVLRFLGRWLGTTLYRPRLSGFRPKPGIHQALLAPGALTAALILDFSFTFDGLQFAGVVVSALVVILLIEELLGYFLTRGWLIEISTVEANRRSTSPWGDWKGGGDA